MREILFRGKRRFNGEWVYGSLLIVGNYYGIIEHDQERLDTVDRFIFDVDTSLAQGYVTKVIPETIGQYTGLTDKNGKKIFEGDIVKLTDYVKETFDVDDGEVKYIGGCFLVAGSNAGIRGSLHTLTDIYWILRGAVIGNIHDNPELLEVKNGTR